MSFEYEPLEPVKMDEAGLVPEPQQEALSPVTSSPKDTSDQTFLQWFQTIVLLCAMVFGIWYLMTQRQGGGDHRDDQKQEEQQATKDASKVLLIHERQTMTAAHVRFLDQMPAWSEARKVQWRSIDDDVTDAPIPKMLAYALTKGISPPCAVLVNPNGDPINATSWPDEPKGLEALWK